MPREEKKYHFIYKTTNILSGKYYIGMHSTDSLEDGYLGSGKRLRYSVNKYGKENHIREILEFLESREKLKEREKEIVSLDELAKETCMNLCVGGEGNGGIKSDEHKKAFQKAGSIAGPKAIQEKIKTDSLFRDKWIKKCEDSWKGMSDDVKKKALSGVESYRGTKHTKETKKLISDKMSGNGKGETNSQYGTCWITKGGLNMKVKKETLDYWLIKEGWVKGRK